MPNADAAKFISDPLQRSGDRRKRGDRTRHRLTALAQKRVVRDDGKELGRLVDLRTRARFGRIERAETMAVDALLLGAHRWLARMGLSSNGDMEVQPSAVITVEEDRIIVRVPAAGSSGTGRSPGQPR